MKIVAKVRTTQKPSEQLSLTEQRLNLLNARKLLMAQAEKLRDALNNNKAAIATNAEAMAKLAGPANTAPNDFNDASPRKPQPAKKPTAKNKLKPEQRVEIIKLLGEGATYKQLAKRFNVSISAIEYWAKKK